MNPLGMQRTQTAVRSSYRPVRVRSLSVNWSKETGGIRIDCGKSAHKSISWKTGRIRNKINYFRVHFWKRWLKVFFSESEILLVETVTNCHRCVPRSTSGRLRLSPRPSLSMMSWVSPRVLQDSSLGMWL